MAAADRGQGPPVHPGPGALRAHVGLEGPRRAGPDPGQVRRPRPTTSWPCPSATPPLVIQKCLRSAVANAEHNDGLDPEELFVSTCFADEGPTLRRFRPRARGRATRIRKRTCHITVVVSRY